MLVNSGVRNLWVFDSSYAALLRNSLTHSEQKATHLLIELALTHKKNLMIQSRKKAKQHVPQIKVS